MQNKLLLSLWIAGGLLYAGGTIFLANTLLGAGTRSVEIAADKVTTTPQPMQVAQCDPASPAADPAKPSARSGEIRCQLGRAQGGFGAGAGEDGGIAGRQRGRGGPGRGRRLSAAAPDRRRGPAADAARCRVPRRR